MKIIKRISGIYMPIWRAHNKIITRVLTEDNIERILFYYLESKSSYLTTGNHEFHNQKNYNFDNMEITKCNDINIIKELTEVLKRDHIDKFSDNWLSYSY